MSIQTVAERETQLTQMLRTCSEALQATTKERDALRTAAQAAINLLGPAAPDCCGCEYEWTHAIMKLQAALEKT